RQCISLDQGQSKILCRPPGETLGGDQYSVPVYTTSTQQQDASSTAIVEGVGVSLFGLYHVVIIIVLINMLIAMMSHSFEDIQKRRETVLKSLKIKEEETSYIDIMHRLVKRYLFKLERAKDEKEK
ncbi:hypothetical protein LOTGIDRAFT_176698, partial [Lottia gigantea]